MNDERETPALDESQSRVGLIVGAIVAAALVAFIVQNTGKARVEWLVFGFTAPLWIVIVVSAVAGLVLGELVGWIMRRRR